MLKPNHYTKHSFCPLSGRYLLRRISVDPGLPQIGDFHHRYDSGTWLKAAGDSAFNCNPCYSK